MKHELKSWPKPFAEIRAGSKRHEVRKNDRPFSVGDVLVLKEWDPTTQEYSGEEEVREVTYVTKGGNWGLPEDRDVLSIQLVVA